MSNRLRCLPPLALLLTVACGASPSQPATTCNCPCASSEGPKADRAPEPSASSTGTVRWVGRVDASDPTAVRFAWQGAGFVATVRGPIQRVRLRTEGTDSVFFQPVVDGVPRERIEVRSGADRTVTLASNLPPGDHQLELYRETEGMYGQSVFLGFTEGTVTGAPPFNGRLIEIVGDSISAGYGNLGTEPHPNWVATPPCHYSAANSSWYWSYGAIAGRALHAEVSTVARSGAGMVRDLAGNTSALGVVPAVYEHALGTLDPKPWSFEPKASAVVIFLGTNDVAKGDPGIAYEDAYLAFLKAVRTHYPDAWLFLAIGSMLPAEALAQMKMHLAAVLRRHLATGDAKVTAFDVGIQELGNNGSVPTGCDWHPSLVEHQRIADILQAQLRAKLHW